MRKEISVNSKEYRNIHDWVRRRKLNDKKCELCGKCDCVLDNALIKGKTHERNIENYMKLCRSCHYKYDHPDGYKHTEDAKNKISKNSKERSKKTATSEKFTKSRVGAKLTEEHKKAISKAVSGENHPKSKLTWEKVKYIRNSNLTSKELADIHNVTYETINNILKNKTWKE